MSGRGKVLVVDDTEATRYLVTRVLRADGYEVLEAGTGQDGLELARREQPGVIVLDVQLPDLHGFEVAALLREDPRTGSIAILHLSATFTSPDARAEGLLRGADAYLTHPVDAQVLCATVGALLRLRAAEQREREARERAEANEARQRFLAETVPQTVWSADGEGRLGYVNGRWSQLTGLTLAEARDGRWEQSIHPDDRERLAAAWARAIRTGEPFEAEVRQGNVRTGEHRWQLVRAEPMHDAEGRVAQWFGTGTDIEEGKRAQAERERLLAQLQSNAEERERLIGRLQEEDRRKTQFLAVLSHELRNPLAPIRASVYVLERAAPGSEQSRHAREVIERQVAQLTRLVDDLLEATRISSGKVRLQTERVELAAVARTVADDLRGVFAGRGMELALDVSTTPVVVEGDRARLSQTIANLLHNAAKFGSGGGRAELSLHPDGAEAVIRVTDDGAGIHADILPRVFDPFVQADRTLDRSQGGLGLGLSLVKSLVELHHGSVMAESEGPGRGARFTIRLPLAPDAAAPSPDVAVSRPSVRPRRVLVVEDNEDAARSLALALELSGHAVEIASSGPEALACAGRFRPEVVVCDVGLPGMDGYQLAAALLADPSLGHPCLVALSGYALPDDVRKALQSGFQYHMAKPADLGALQRLLVEVAGYGP
jgi:PAS domain S-box-containing protein